MTNPSSSVTTESGDFVEIPIGDFVRGKSVDFDIYIRLEAENTTSTTQRFVKLARGAEDLSHDRIDSFIEKGIHFLYLKKDDFNKYLLFESTIIAAAAQSDIVLQKKMQLVRVTFDMLQKKFMRCELVEEDFRIAAKIVESTISVLASLPDGESLLASLEGLPRNLYSHGSAVSILATLIAKKLKWTSSSALRKVSMAGLFHDIGKRDFPRELIMMPLEKMSEADKKLYETHPILGSEILKRSHAIPLDVANAVLQHHECMDGSGFPNGLRLGRIQPIALILAVADEFIHRYLDLPNPKKTDLEGILQQMMDEGWKKYAGEAVIALYELFGLQTDEQLRNKLVRGVLKVG